jgi:hypothetical protein
MTGSAPFSTRRPMLIYRPKIVAGSWNKMKNRGLTGAKPHVTQFVCTKPHVTQFVCKMKRILSKLQKQPVSKLNMGPPWARCVTQLLPAVLRHKYQHMLAKLFDPTSICSRRRPADQTLCLIVYSGWSSTS